MLAVTTLHLQVLGVPRLRRDGQSLNLRTRKVLALMVYLILEPRAHSRDELAERLWPAQPGSARASLRFALHHLHAALGDDLPLILTPGSVELPRTDQLWVDALELELQAANHAALPTLEAAALWQGDFMTGFILQDAPGWDEWATTQARRYRDRHDAVLARLTDARLRAGQVWDAIEMAQKRVAHDPFNENAYQQLSRAQSAAGLNAAAAVTLRTCADVLERELGLELPPHLDGGPRPPTGTNRNPTFSSARPLVGRKAELQQMADALSRGQVIFLSGEAGAGKTALAAEFLARHPDILAIQVEAQPIDVAIPYAVQARAVRTSWAAVGQPEMPAELVRELARIVPELSPESPAPLTTPEQKLRLFDAFTNFIGFVNRAGRPRQVSVLAENLHWWDRESHMMGAYAAVNGPPRGAFSWAILTYRPELIPGEFIDMMRPVVNAGLAVIIDVPPLSAGQTHELLAQFDPRVSVGVAERLHEYTAGNPLFVTETATLLQTRGGLFQAELKELPRSKRIRDTIAERLSRLTPDVLAVARVAAVAAAEFSFRLAAQVLGADTLSLAAAFETLESAGLFRGEGFAHDLLRDTAYDLTPLPARTVLHGRVLDALHGERVPPAVLARHAVEARRWDEARAWLLRSSEEARHVMAEHEAEVFSRHAATLPVK